VAGRCARARHVPFGAPITSHWAGPSDFENAVSSFPSNEGAAAESHWFISASVDGGHGSPGIGESGRDVLNIRPHKGGLVEGYLFEVSQQGWEALDKKEGHPRFYRRETVTVLDQYGAEIQAMTYRVVPEKREDFVEPNEAYLAICRRGRERFELSTDGLDLAAENGSAVGCSAVFVYGTLMRGEIRASTWADQAVTFVSMAEAQGHLVDHDNYPGFIPAIGASDQLVQGEFLMFENVSEVLARLDRIEGFRGFGVRGSLFRRTFITVAVGGRIRSAWTYATCQTAASVIASGNWRESRSSRTDAFRRTVAGYISAKKDFLASLVHAPASPFSNLYDEEPRFDQVLNDLLSGRIDERSLALAAQVPVTFS
jgi:gamma-glutamylcyclotransferase (GGCT)/AIG2-like uncharacterized protein YtfP